MPKARLTLELTWNRVVVDGLRIDLTTTECRLVARLASAAPGCVPGPELLADVWGYTPDRIRTVKTTIHRLRQKLESDPSRPEFLLTVPGQGYRLDDHTTPDGPALPRSRGAWVDRPDARARIETSLGAGRIAFVVGPGGIGKTRLATEILRAASSDLRGGARRVFVVGEATRDRLVGAVADDLGLPLEADGVHQIGRALADRGPCLLLLDNLDEVRPDALECIETWHRAAPELQLLITARTWRPLDGADRIALDPLSLDQAVALFNARAREAGSDLPDDSTAINRLVDALDRMPLAVELAAACIDVLTVAELTDRLVPSAPLQALEDTFAASWLLLTAPARAVLVQVAAFADGFTASAAEAVVRLDGSPPLAQLRSLRQASLLDRQDGRFRLLPALREHLHHRDPIAIRQATSRMVHWAAAEAERHRQLLHTDELDRAQAWFATERNNLLASLDADPEPDQAAALVRAMGELAEARRSTDARDLLCTVLERTDLADTDRAPLERLAARLEAGQGDAAAADARFGRAAALAGPELRDQLDYDRAELWLVTGRFDDAEQTLRAVLERELPDVLRAHALRRLGTILRHRGSADDALTALSEAVEAADRSGSVPARVSTRVEWAEHAHDCARPIDAVHERFAEATQLAKAHGLTLSLAYALSIEGQVAMHAGDPVDARRLLTRAIDLHRRSGISRGRMHLLHKLGWIEATLGERASARASIDAALELANQHATVLVPLMQATLAIVELDEGRASQALTRMDAALELVSQRDSALNLATVLFYRAWALGAAGRTDDALADIARARPLCETAAPPLWGELLMLKACLVPEDREAFRAARDLASAEVGALGAIRVLQARAGRPQTKLTVRVRTEAEKTAFGRQVLRFLEPG